MKLTPIEPWTADRIGDSGHAITRADIQRYQLERLRFVLHLASPQSH
jgi:hypothetical protein